jgi:hypothetical protein
MSLLAAAAAVHSTRPEGSSRYCPIQYRSRSSALPTRPMYVRCPAITKVVRRKNTSKLGFPSPIHMASTLPRY